MPVANTLNSTSIIKFDHTRHSESDSGLFAESADQPQKALSESLRNQPVTGEHDATAVRSHGWVDTERSAYESASETYEYGLFDAKQLASHRHNQAVVTDALRPFLARGAHQSADCLSQVVREVVSHLAQTGQLQLDCYREREPGVHGYGKFLLYSHADRQYPFCLQLFAFKPGQKTPLHDHPCECMSLVVRGAVIEELYDAGQGELRGLLSAEKRTAASSVSIALDQLHLAHRLINDRHVQLNFSVSRGIGKGEMDCVSVELRPAPVALTVHLYQGMDGGVNETQAVSQRRYELTQQRRAITAVSRVYQ